MERGKERVRDRRREGEKDMRGESESEVGVKETLSESII